MISDTKKCVNKGGNTMNYERTVKLIVDRHGGHREKEIYKGPHTIHKGETWNREHKVLYILEKQPQPDGYRAGFAVDIVNNNIVG